MLRFSLFFKILILVKWTQAADFSCPTDPIFRQSGTFPKDALTLTTFPSNYNCDINFSIEDGFVYQLTIATNATNGSGDSIVVTDAMGKQLNYTNGVFTFFAPAKSATVSIKSVTGKSQFWFRYTNQPVGQLQQNKMPTGSRLRLVLSEFQTYTFISPYNDNVVINTAMVDNINQVDEKLKNIYVYDGVDVNSQYVGNLYDYVTSPILSKSSGNATTIANFYGKPTTSYALANDYNSLTLYDTYNFIAYTNNVTIPNNFQTGISNAYTFYCTDHSQVYLTDLNFGKDGHKVDFRTLTPSDTVKFLLEYLATGPYARSLPQLIPGRMFTMVTIGPELSFTLSSTSDNWLTPYNGRRGTVFSESLWNIGASPAYNYTFESNVLMKFTFNFDSVVIQQAGEQVQVQVGQPGFQPASVTFTKSVTNPGVRVANGTYFNVNYIGTSPMSSSIITFEMVNADGSVPSTTISPTVASSVSDLVETTTKVGSKSGFGYLGVLILLLVNFL